jgi:hypothetical protein
MRADMSAEERIRRAVDELTDLGAYLHGTLESETADRQHALEAAVAEVCDITRRLTGEAPPTRDLDLERWLRVQLARARMGEISAEDLAAIRCLVDLPDETAATVGRWLREARAGGGR